MKKQLYILPFDHRHTFYHGLFGWDLPLSKKQTAKIKEAKQMIWQAFLQVYKKSSDKENFGVLVDEEFGSEILKQAKKLGVVRMLTTEKSGQETYDFEYGANFGSHILKFKPDYAKALVRYNPVNKKENLIQLKCLKKLNNFCKQKKIGFLFELLVPASPVQFKKYGKGYDLKARPALTRQAIKEIRAFGVKPNIWKLEAMPKNDWTKLIKLIGKNEKIIILGRAGSKDTVTKWLKTAAQFNDIIGFAVGRTIFYAPLEKWKKGEKSKKQAVALMARNFSYFVNLWKSIKY